MWLLWWNCFACRDSPLYSTFVSSHILTNNSGTIVARGSNNQGVVGVVSDINPYEGISLHITKGLDNTGSGSTEGVMKAVDDCINAGARIISMSLGGGDYNSVEANAFRTAYENGVLVVAAASNDNSDAKEYPASLESVMSVAALQDAEPYYRRAYFSNFNKQVEIAAPGYSVKSTVPGNEYRSWSGTSMATPHVAGAAALLWSYNQSCSAKQIRRILLASSMPLADGGCDVYYGRGMVQVQDAIDMLVNGGCGAADGLGIFDDTKGYNQDNTCDNVPYFERCLHGQETLKLTLLTDDSPTEISWEVKNTNNDGLVSSGGNYDGANTEYAETIDLCIGRPYEFVMKDSGGNGIGGNGGYMLELQGSLGTKVMKSFGSFSSGTETTGDIFPRGCQAGKEIVMIELLTDEWPDETSWELVDVVTGEQLLSDVYSDDDDLEEFLYQTCVDLGTSLQFTVYDSYGDGICCDHGRGSFTVRYGDEVVVENAGEFEDFDTYSFTISDPDSDCNVNSDCPNSFDFLACPSICDNGKCKLSYDCNCDHTCTDDNDASTCEFDCGTPDEELTTTTVDNNGQAGNMWRIKARSDIQIQQFEINAGDKEATLVAKVYTKAGDYRGSETRPEDWILLQDVEIISNGDPALTPLPFLSIPIVVDSGNTQSFYVTLTTSNLKYTNGNSEENIVASNLDLEVYEGVGKSYPFGNTFRPRIWNGKILYQALSRDDNDSGNIAAPGGCSRDSDCQQASFPFVCPSFSCNLVTNICEESCNCDLTCDQGETAATCPSGCSSTNGIVTETVANNQQAGNMFKVEVQKRDLQILQFDVHAMNTGAKLNAKVYTKEGDYTGYDTDPAAWTILQEVSDVTSLGEGTLTPLPPLSSGSIILKAGSTHSFYVTLTTATMKYTNGVKEGLKHSSSNNDIHFFEGLGKKFPFGTAYAPRIWNGKISYVLL